LSKYNYQLRSCRAQAGTMTTIVESVPNFSEGRRKEVIDAIVSSMGSVPGIRILDVETDTDHNRSVVTLVGDKDSIQEAAFRGAKSASELIDLNKHRGQHPRMGALDVLPFVPISGVTMKDCVEIANKVGSRIAKELGIPVYLYESAARRPERVNLEDVRRGEFEGLRDAIKKDDSRYPDYGPGEVHPTAGAIAVGARMPLVAFNVNLKSSDLSIAKAIAKKIRASNGGFPKVKALGLMLAAKGMVQVSMNLTDYTVTGIPTVFEAIRSEAEERGVEIAESEVIGLIPLDALCDVARVSLKVSTFTSNQVLERKIWD
jgi:glutamate formiminotransferase